MIRQQSWKMSLLVRRNQFWKKKLKKLRMIGDLRMCEEKWDDICVCMCDNNGIEEM